MRAPMFILTLALGPGSLLAEDANLTVHSETAVADIHPVAEGRKLIRLPTLEFTLTVRVECGQSESPSTVSISIADSRTTIAEGELRQGSEVNSNLSVSAKQLAPVAVTSFCVAGEPQSQKVLLKRSLLTAQASLRCESEKSQSVSYVAVPLDVELNCLDDRTEHGNVEL